MRLPTRSLLLLLLSGLLAGTALEAQAAPRRELLHRLGAGEKSALSPPPAARAAEPVSVDLGALAETDLDLPLLDGAVYRLLRTGLERRGPAELTWRGDVLGADGEALGTATLTRAGRLLTGLISLPGAVYQILPGKNGAHQLAEIDVDRLDPCAGAVTVPLAHRPRAGARTAAALEAAATAKAGAPTQIDLLVVYTPAARVGAGGVSAIRLVAQSQVDIANSAYLNSRVDVHLNLAAVNEIDYTETGTARTDLDWVRRDRTVANLRRAAGADVVTLLVERMDDACGVGYEMNRARLSPAFASLAFNAVRRICAPRMVIAHEVGHNLGCEHDPANGEPPSQASFPWSFGHYVDGTFRTVMSYDTGCSGGCTRIANFSNPDVAFQGIPTGVPEERDNHRTLNATRTLVAGFMTQQPCQPGPQTLCLLGRRFRVEVTWENQFDGSDGIGQAIPRTDAAGFFSFGDPGNVELMVKMLDFGDAVKLFYGQLTNLRFRLTVTDTERGQVKTYENTAGDCGAVDSDGFADTAASLLAPAAVKAGSCRPARDTLCLGGGRFQVKVDWANPGNGRGGAASAVPLSPVTGAFYFTEPANLELLAKVLDFGDRIDFFYGTLSDLEYTIAVTDTRSGTVKTYRNPAGTFCGGLDVHAF